MPLQLFSTQSVDSIIDALPAQIAVLDKRGDIRVANRSWRATASAGCLGEPRGGRWNYLDECRASAKRGCAEAINALEGLRQVLHGERPEFVMNYPCPFDGQHHWYQLTVAAVDHAGEPGAIVMHTDVTSLQHDALTGLANRAMFEAQLWHNLAEAGRHAVASGVVLLDLDGFKPVNDTYGHAAGDALLVAVASRLEAAVRDYDLVARLGGDEFAVVPAAPVTPEQLVDLARRLCTTLAASFTLPVEHTASPGEAAAVDHPLAVGREVSVGASVGVALFPDHGTDVESLVEAADTALYAAKHAGRNRVALAGADPIVTSVHG